jgi:hypothetical protein
MGFMDFISKLLAGSGGKDPHAVHPELGPVIAAGRNLDGRPAQALFASTRGRWDLRTWVAELTADGYFMKMPDSARQQMIDALIAQGELGWVLARGVWHMSMGWKARGSGGADSVSKEGWDELARRCDLAQQDLMLAAERDPEDPTAYTLMLRLARGRSDRELGEKMYAEAIARDPMGYEPHVRFLSIVSERWMGSHDEMLGLARGIAARAPDGSDSASLPIAAHFDRFSHTCCFDEDYGAGCEYLSHPAVQNDVAQALTRSVDAPGYQLTPSSMFIRHTAAAVFWHGGNRAAARTQLSRVGDTYYKTAWWPDQVRPGKYYKSVRQQLGLR